jgi:hypothetical protein
VRIFRNPNVQVILVEHRDRLVRFGFEYVEAVLGAQGRRVLVIDVGQITDDIVRDLHEVIVSMCARRYGKSGAKNRIALVATASQEVLLRQAGAEAGLQVGGGLDRAGHGSVFQRQQVHVQNGAEFWLTAAVQSRFGDVTLAAVVVDWS